MVVSHYESTRQERIKENLERMQKLGLVELSSNFNSLSASSRKPSTGGRKRPFQKTIISSTPETSGPQRRSSRLQNVTPVSYCTEPVRVKGKRSQRILMYRELDMGPRTEIYSEEDEKLLGNTEREWVLFVDGCGQDGRRIYDPIKGKTCHQCRQKTLGHRTHCSECQMVQGQFCGDCLFMRYGEHVLEALENPDWVCPVCRGICNCSLCRQAKGWPPTGSMYRKIVALGYKSVAHYLVQTRRCDDTEKNPSSSTRRSLPFSRDREETTPLKQCVASPLLLTSGAETLYKNVTEDGSSKQRTEAPVQSSESIAAKLQITPIEKCLASGIKTVRGNAKVTENCQTRVLRSHTKGAKTDSVAGRVSQRRRLTMWRF